MLWSDRKRTLFGLPLSFTKYELTEDKLVIKSGFLKLQEDEVRLYRITDVSLTRTLGQRLFGLGTIACCSSDKTLGDFEIKNVKDSGYVKETLSEAIELQRDKKRVSSREFLTDFDEEDNDEVE